MIKLNYLLAIRKLNYLPFFGRIQLEAHFFAFHRFRAKVKHTKKNYLMFEQNVNFLMFYK